MNTYRQLWHNQNLSYHKKVDQEGSPVVVRPIYSLISVGTERSMITTADLSPATANRMRVPFMSGEFGKDFTYGYSLVGEVIDGPEHFLGKNVHLLHPHQELALVDEASLYIIPVGVDLKQATLASNMETAVNAVWDARLEMGDQVLVVGYGQIGALVAKLCERSLGVTVVVAETDQKRAALAIDHGFEIWQGDTQPNFDIAFHTSGTSEGLQFSVEQIGSEGKVIELSWYGSRETKLRLGESFHYDRKQIISSQVSSLPSRKNANWDYHKRKDLVFDLLSQIDFGYLIQGSIPFDQAPDFFNSLRRKSPSEIGIIIDYNE
ncbi:MAG: zinc-binding alcohol dehydrogenase [Cyclobacteriaceae bacterium]